MRRGPNRSSSRPTASRAKNVSATEAITLVPICCRLKPRSSRISGMSGATANHPTNEVKNASQLMWKARIGGLEKSASLMRVARSPDSISASARIAACRARARACRHLDPDLVFTQLERIGRDRVAVSRGRGGRSVRDVDLPAVQRAGDLPAREDAVCERTIRVGAARVRRMPLSLAAAEYRDLAPADAYGATLAERQVVERRDANE